MTDLQETLLLEVHHSIAVAAKDAVEKLSFPLEELVAEVLYPSAGASDSLTDAEATAIGGLNLSPEARSGLEKLFADAAASAFFRFFTLLDGASHPEVQPQDDWNGAVLAAPEGARNRRVLHDDFFESYSRYREAIGRTG